MTRVRAMLELTEFVCRSCREGGPDWMCQCDNDEAWEQWMREQELRTLDLARAADTPKVTPNDR